jgi:hypothetical protein
MDAAMDRREFFYLYANINSIAELALMQLAEQILSQPAVPNPDANLTPEEIEAHMKKSFENLDWSALDGVGQSNGADEPLDPAFLETLQAPPDLASFEKNLENEGPLDIGKYLTKAYGHEDELRARIDSHYNTVDLPSLHAALNRLPGHLRALTGPLSAEEMQEWLKLYNEDNDALGDLTIEIRRLDMPDSRPT